jgi:hypothetical protein
VECECGCGWEGEDEVTQYLIEEAVLWRPRIDEANAIREAERDTEEQRLLDRHAELTAMRERMQQRGRS